VSSKSPDDLWLLAEQVRLVGGIYPPEIEKTFAGQGAY